MVTGIGTFTSLGHDVHTLFDELLLGKCGINSVARFDPALSAVKISSEVQNFDVGSYWDLKDAKRFVLYSIKYGARTVLPDRSINISILLVLTQVRQVHTPCHGCCEDCAC